MKTKIMFLIVCLMSGQIAFAQSSTSASAPTSSSGPAGTELPAQPSEQGQTDWKPIRAWAGDLRFRVRDQKAGLNDTRIFEVLRARLAYRADIQTDLTAYLRFATATSPISANQVLGDTQGTTAAPGMQRRAFGLDLAYLEYRPLANTTGWLGKTPVAFYSPAKDQMVFDADLDFEGASVKWAQDVADVGGGFNVFANLGSSLVSENYASPNDLPDMALLGAQLGASYKWYGTLTADVAYYTWDNAQGRSSLQVNGATTAPNSRLAGNTTDAGATTLASKFNIIQAAVDWQHVWSMGMGDVTTELFYDFGRNGDANIGGASYETGLVLKYGKWAFGYGNVLKEADSQLGAFTDSDTNGGGTDVVGNRENITYQVSKAFSLTLTNYNGKRGISLANQTDFSETQFDLMGTF